MAGSEPFLELSGDEVVRLLQSPDTSVPCESVALSAALRWLGHDPEGRRELADQLVDAIRVAYLPQDALQAAASHPVLQHAPRARQRLLSASQDDACVWGRGDGVSACQRDCCTSMAER